MTTFLSKAFIAAFIALAILAGPAQADDKAALAKQYIASVPVESDIKAAVESLSNNVQPDQRVLFRSIADKSIDYAKLRASAEQTVVDMFTENEIKAMIAFYSTPEGQSIRKKMPEYEKRMQPVMIEVMQGFVTRLQENNIVMQGK